MIRGAGKVGVNNRKLHDGIIGIFIVTCVGLSQVIGPVWLWGIVAIGVTMFQSAFSGFCPLYLLLNKLYPEITTQRKSEGILD